MQLRRNCRPVKNLGTVDRVIRVFLAELCILAAFFWRAGEWQILLYLIAAVLLVQAATGVCGLYNLLRWNTCEIVKRRNKNLTAIVIVLVVIFAAIGGYGSAVLTRNMFVQDLQSLQEPYSQTMIGLLNGEKADALAGWEKMNSSYNAFETKYSSYRPVAVRYDGQLSGDLENITAILQETKVEISQGNLTQAREDLLQVEVIIDDVKARNGLS
jgi:hypothetical protein